MGPNLYGYGSELPVHVDLMDGTSPDPPFITSNLGGAISIPENTTAITTVTASGSLPITLSISGGDSALLSFNPATGVLAFTSAPDYENPLDIGRVNIYHATVFADNVAGENTQDLAVTVTDVSDPAPTITSSSTFSVAENQTAVGTLTATGFGTLVFSKAGGDSAKFTLTDNGNGTATLVFASAPDFEAPTDSNADNIYTCPITVAGGTLPNATQTINVTVTNVADVVPVITSLGGGAAGSCNGHVGNTGVTTVTATADAPLTYTITGGAQAAKFSLNPTTGELTYTVAPVVGAIGNLDVVIVQAASSVGSDSQTITVTVAAAVSSVSAPARSRRNKISAWGI